MRCGVLSSAMLIISVVAKIPLNGEKCQKERYILLECRKVRANIRSLGRLLNLTIQVDEFQLMPEVFGFALKIGQTQLDFTVEKAWKQPPRIGLSHDPHWRFPVTIQLLTKSVTVYAEGKKLWNGRDVFEKNMNGNLITGMEVTVLLPFSGVWIELMNGTIERMDEEPMGTWEKFGISMIVAVIIVMAVVGSLGHSTYEYCMSEDKHRPSRRPRKHTERERLVPLFRDPNRTLYQYCTAFPRQPEELSTTAMAPTSEPSAQTARSRSPTTAVIPTQPSSNNSSATTRHSLASQKQPPLMESEMTAVDTPREDNQENGTSNGNTRTNGTTTTIASASSLESKRPLG